MAQGYLDNDRHNNLAENLAWVTPRTNSRDHRLAHGHDPRVVPYKLTIEQLAMLPGLVAEGLPKTEIARRLGASYGAIIYATRTPGQREAERIARSYTRAVRRASHRARKTPLKIAEAVA